jgi:hypothetical protein
MIGQKWWSHPVTTCTQVSLYNTDSIQRKFINTGGIIISNEDSDRKGDLVLLAIGQVGM